MFVLQFCVINDDDDDSVKRKATIWCRSVPYFYNVNAVMIN